MGIVHYKPSILGTPILGNPIYWIFIIPNMKGRIPQLIINHQLIIAIYIVPLLHIIFHHHHQFYYILLSPVLQFHYYHISSITIYYPIYIIPSILPPTSHYHYIFIYKPV